MKRLTLRTENQWRSLKDGAGVDLLRVSFVCNGFQAGASVTVAGLGLGLTYWKRESSMTLQFPCGHPVWVGDGIDIRTPVQSWASVKSSAWEPIETDGWAGEPQGREKAP